MKKFSIVFLSALSIVAYAQVTVHPYVDRNGVYHQGYQRTTPNNTAMDNYSTKGNFNPYTGQEGTKNSYPQPSYAAPTYSQPRIHTPACKTNAYGQYECR